MKPARLSLGKNIAWNSAGSVVYLFFQWLLVYLVVMLLGFKDAGIFSLAISIANVSFAFAIYGVRGYQVSDVDRKYSDKSYIRARVVTCLLAVLGTLIYVVVHGYGLYVTLCTVAYLVFKMSEAYVDVYHGIIQRGLRMDYIGKSFILRGIIPSLLFIASAAITKSLLFSTIVLAASAFGLVFYYDRKNSKLFYEDVGETSTKTIRGLLLECLPLAAYVLLTSLVMSIPRISLESIKGSELLGIYASIAIPAAIIQVISGYIFAPLLTVFAEHVSQKNFELFHSLFFKTLFYITAVSVVLIGGGAVLGRFGLILLFGNKISNYTYLFLPILFISALTALSWYIGLMLTVIREFKGLIIASSVAVMTCMGGSRWFIHHFGINGASFVLIVALVLQVGLMGVFMALRLRILKRTVS